MYPFAFYFVLYTFCKLADCSFCDSEVKAICHKNSRKNNLNIYVLTTFNKGMWVISSTSSFSLLLGKSLPKDTFWRQIY